MHRLILIFMLMVFGTVSSACNLSIVRKGMWRAVCIDVEISSHNRYDKALEAVSNQNSDCVIIPPDRIEVSHSEIEVVEELESYLITWSHPNEKQDGSALTTIDRFIFYYGLNGSFQNVVPVEATSNSYTLANLAAGSYSISMSTVSNGLEGPKSEPIIVKIVE